MDKRQFWGTKSPLPEYHAVTFTHPAFTAPFRLVANQFAPVTLGGIEHRPCPMALKPPEAKNGAAPKLTMQFPRQVVGSEFKQQLKRISAASDTTPISVLYEIYCADTDEPEASFELYVSDRGGITFDQKQVQVVATEDNPMRRNAAIVYRPDEWLGLDDA